MAKALIITEKPSIARDISEALGGFTSKNNGEYYESDEFVCTYAVGHILGLMAPEDVDPKYKRWRLSDLPIIPEKFQLKPIERQKGRIKIIEKLIKRKDVDLLINACDAAREGELIFREIIQFVGSDKKIKRLWLQSMTKDAIRTGFAKLTPGEQHEGLAQAAACRSYSDWLIGMNATRALTVRLKTRSERGSSWSAGRVQTPTLALLVKRELEILNHIPVPYFKIEANFKAKDHDYDSTWYDPKFKKSTAGPDAREDRIFDAKLLDKILADTEGKEGLASETRKPKPRKAPQLFDLTSLQREANRRFSWSAVRTLRAAQRCYETHKVLTYPRTSSKYLPMDYVEVTKKLFETLANGTIYSRHAQYLIDNGIKNEPLIFDDSKISDHFAIIPTGETKDLEGDDKKLFDLVTRQFLAAFYPPAIFEDVERITVVGEHNFKSKPPMVLKEPGWQAVFEKTAGERTGFSPLIAGKNAAEGVPVNNKDIEKQDHQTRPPGRIGEAGLLSLMENAGRQLDDEELSHALQKAEGLGTAATRADIIENLKAKEYVDPTLRPTVKGIRLIDVLERIKAGTITSAELTGQLELQLNEVESGKRTSDSFMEQVAKITEQVVDATRDFDYEGIYPDIDPLGKCPKCGGDVFEKAWFYGCNESTKRTDEPKKCDFLIWKDHYGRYIDRRSVHLLLTDGTTGELDGFKNQSGRTYKAVLALEDKELVRKPVEGSEEEVNITIEVNETPLGACPVHKEEGDDCKVKESKIMFICETKQKAIDEKITAEGFSFPRVLCKREMKREEIIQYMKEGVTPYLTNFISKKGRPFSARLRMNDAGGFAFEFPERKPKAKKGEKKEESEAAQ